MNSERKQKRSDRRTIGNGLVISSWLAALIVMLIPAYHGEFLTPGGVSMVPAFGMVFGPAIFALAGLSHGYGGIEHLVYPVGLLITMVSFLATPVCMMPGVARQVWLLITLAVILTLATAAWFISIFTISGTTNELLAGAYLVPAPLLAAALGLILYATAPRT